QTCALRGERGAEIGKDLGALRVEVGRCLTVGGGADLAGDEKKLRRLDARDMRILPKRLTEAVGVDHLNARHERSVAIRLAASRAYLLHLSSCGSARLEVR